MSTEFYKSYISILHFSVDGEKNVSHWVDLTVTGEWGHPTDGQHGH